MKKEFSLASHAGRMTSLCVPLVHSELSDCIPLSMNNFILITQAIAKYDNDQLKKYAPFLARYHKIFKRSEDRLTMIWLSARMRGVILQSIEAAGTGKEEFELLRLIIRWYGISRKKAVHFKEYIPEDTRDSHYSNEYDGPTREQFTLDHIALNHEEELVYELEKDLHSNPDKYFDTQGMTSAVENNSWSLDKVGV